MHKYARYAWRFARPIVGILAILAVILLGAAALAVLSPALAVRIYIEEFKPGRLPWRGPTDAEDLQLEAWEISGVTDIARQQGRAQ